MIATVTDNVFAPRINKEIPKLSPEIIHKIKELITHECSYINAIFNSKLIHIHKMTMLYICGVADHWVTISEISINTSLPQSTIKRALKDLFKNKYIKSEDFSKDIKNHTSFTFSLTQKILDEYLLNMIRNENAELNINNHTQ